jgi:hypothetical protein
LIIIDTLETYAGKLPPVQRKKVVYWATDKKEFLITNFKLLNPRL